MKVPKFLTFAIIAIIVIGVILVLPSNESNKVKIQTSKGDIIIELNSEKAPITVENFKQYVKDKFYDETVFHRVIPGFMIQGGGFNTTGHQKTTREPIELESNNGLANDVGTIAMARTAVPDSATSQFFINTVNNGALNYGVRDEGYAVFGKVIEGMDVVTAIESATTNTRNNMQNWPIEEIKIISVELI